MNKAIQLILAILVVAVGVGIIIGGKNYAEKQYQDKVAKINEDIIEETSDAVRSMNIARTEKATEFVYGKGDELIRAAKDSSDKRRSAQWTGGAITGAGVLWFFAAAALGSRARTHS